jgi:hypothetical protein
MRQALHIFRKDARHLWPEISLVLALAAVFLGTRPDWIELALFPAAGYLLARLVHSEAIAGDRQFWITRPYRWQSLLAAKLLFMLVFVHLPILLVQLWVVATAGFPLSSYLPGLLWSQALLLLVVTLPIVALAAITPGIVSFIFSILILLAIWYGVVNANTFRTMWPYGIGWIRALFIVLAISGIAISIVYAQYRRRKTLLSRAIGVAGLALVGAAAWFTPWTAAWALQTRLSKQAFDPALLQIAADPNAVRFHPVQSRTWSNVDVWVPVAVGPAPSGVFLATDVVAITFEGADGAVWKSEIGGVRRAADKAGRMMLEVNSKLSLGFFNREREKPLTIRGSLYMTLFGNARERTIPLRDEPVNALDGLQCHVGTFDQFTCRSAFQWPGAFVYARFGEETRPLRGIFSYSPFPANLLLNPIETSWAPAPRTTGEVTVVVKEPLAHIRRDFELRGVRVIAGNGSLPWR